MSYAYRNRLVLDHFNCFYSFICIFFVFLKIISNLQKLANHIYLFM